MVKQYQLKGELDGMPPKDELYRIAEEYVSHKEAIKDTQKIMDDMKPQLIEAFRRDGREKIGIRGTTVSYAEVASIRVSSPKE